jgi:hypothetical protein
MLEWSNPIGRDQSLPEAVLFFLTVLPAKRAFGPFDLRTNQALVALPMLGRPLVRLRGLPTGRLLANRNRDQKSQASITSG